MGATKNLILGGSGTIGSALCRHLLAQKEEVINVDLKTGFDLRVRDLDEFSDVDYVWFLAWEVGGAKFLSNPAYQQQILLSNVQLCARVFAFLEKTKIPFLFTSSQLAAPDTAYGMTKLLGERLTESLQGTVVRFWNVYGWEEPGEKSHVITDMILQALNKKKITLLTTGREERQFIYIDDCVRNLCHIRESGRTDTVHLTNGRWMSILELADAVAGVYEAEVVAGATTGYQNKIDPHPSYRQFSWDTDLTQGIRKIGVQAKDYIKEHADVFKIT